jgi:RNA polymerase sigma factor for flagellar operon FliA
MVVELEKVREREMKEILIDIVANKLDEEERLVIALVFYEELSIKEIAEVLQRSEEEVLQLYTRVMERIRMLLAVHSDKEVA